MRELPIVREFMTVKTIVLRPGDTVNEAIDVLTQNRISGAPVLDDAGELVGILSQRDCLTWLVNQNYYDLGAGKVEDFMSKGVHTIHQDADLFTAADLFIYHHFRRVPVVDDEGKLVGIVSRHDVIRAGSEQCKTWQEEAADPGYVPDRLKARLGRDGVPHLTRSRSSKS